MLQNEKSMLVLLVQNCNNVFCYFNISPITVKQFEDKYGENSWRNSKPAIKVYEIVNGCSKEIKTILIDPFANNWYVHLDKDDMDVFVKLGRILPDDTYAPFAVSNTVTTPRSKQSDDTTVCYIDVSHNFKSNSHVTNTDWKSRESAFSQPKPYPFSEDKKKTR